MNKLYKSLFIIRVLVILLCMHNFIVSKESGYLIAIIWVVCGLFDIKDLSDKSNEIDRLRQRNFSLVYDLLTIKARDEKIEKR